MIRKGYLYGAILLLLAPHIGIAHGGVEDGHPEEPLVATSSAPGLSEVFALPPTYSPAWWAIFAFFAMFVALVLLTFLSAVRERRERKDRNQHG